MNVREKPDGKPVKREEKLSKRDLEDLMGTRRPIYEKRNGKIKQK